MHIRNLSAAANTDQKCYQQIHICYFKVICSVIRNPSAVSARFLPLCGPRCIVAPTVAPTVGFRQLPERRRRDYKVLVLCSVSVKVLRHAQRVNNTLQTVFYKIFFTQIYNALIVWHSKPCENEHENMYFAPQIFKYAYRSYFMSYIECMQLY